MRDSIQSVSSDADAPRAPECAASRFVADENGAAFLEFLIVLFPFMFVLFGVAQTGLMVMASFYTNYANYMALRTASVCYELRENGFIDENEFRNRCVESAVAALGPIEPFIYRNYHGRINQGQSPNASSQTQIDQLKSRIAFIYQVSGDRADGMPVFIEGRLEYEYPLIIPFAGGVISALGRGISPGPAGDSATNRVMHEFVTSKASGELAWPSIWLRSSDATRTPEGSPPYFHRVVIQRRWLYPDPN